MMAAEKLFENHVKAFLKSQGCWFVKYWGGGQFTKAGIPDLLVCCKGKFIALEIKAPTGKPSELQLYNVEKIKEAGGIAMVLYPKDFDKFKELVRNL
jgi:Holliday junction resolvase